MKCARLSNLAVLGVVCLLGLLNPIEASACATCFGKSDSSLAQGMNMGILCLLGVLAVVLGSVASFFVYLARRSTRLATAGSSTLRDESLDLKND